VNTVRNILAIAGKELRSYFASPIAYVIIGLFALLFSRFFYAYLMVFVQRSSGMMGTGGGANNINQEMIRYVLMNSAVIILFVMPMITMRTYSEEKRSGTIELLLTSPLTDLEIIVGKFLGAMGLYCAMLAVTVAYMGILFFYGNPEWRPVVAGYLGLVLLGGCFISVGLLISSLTKNQIVAGVITFAVFLMLWIINWSADQSGPTMRAVLNHLSIINHFDDFARGIIDTKHVVYYLSFITFGLFLTAKSVDSERWRG
jgi:gliding motility-associated transport system permease protein